MRAGTVGGERVRHPERGARDLAHAAFAVAEHPGLALVVHLDPAAAVGRERPGPSGTAPA